MSRIVIDLPDEDLKVLDAIKEIQGKPRAEIIRAAISGYLQNNSADDDAEAFGIWSMGNGDGLEFQRAMRGEWPQ
ncbi:MAG: ribbon-helix-helix protein, CopG family [Synergistaceae bacterium]|nr:ribbon-helix-helix protein, CopG family [Synergistaceae bacterium]